ncbi:MAG: hypothetical protein QXY40_05495 [Candidatus Methanomethylicia archaeon]
MTASNVNRLKGIFNLIIKPNSNISGDRRAIECYYLLVYTL